MATVLQNPPLVSEVLVTVCKLAYKPLVNESDQLIISNWGALRLGLQAALKEDADDQDRADALWNRAKQLLISEEENLVGSGAQGSIQMQDDFEMSCFPYGM